MRPVPEAGICLVYNPRDPGLRTLTPAAWLLLELCDGRSFADLRSVYLAVVTRTRGARAAQAWFRDGLAQLQSHGLIEQQPAAPPS
jgi:hypothetical protein